MGLLHLARDLLKAKGWLGKVEELRPFNQLSEKLPKSLPPSEEEAKKKGWWLFWK